jgi:hypothetical protein
MGTYVYLTFESGVLWVLVCLLILLTFGTRFVSDLMDVMSKKKQFAGMAISALLTISATLGLCQSYATFLYPKIENKYGGGKPVLVTLFLGKEMEPLSELLFEDNQGSSRAIKDVTLIDEDGDYFYIQRKGSQQNKTIRIKKSLVNAIIHGMK